jgi:ssDNA-binding Zn-finger/Zn-ribbon topoisomerase 1
VACKYCHQTFKRACEYKRHLRKHEKPEKCPVGGINCKLRRNGTDSFAWARDLDRHIEARHPERRDLMKNPDRRDYDYCDYPDCKKSDWLMRKDNLRRHKKRLHGILVKEAKTRGRGKGRAPL